MSGDRRPMVHLATLWERESRSGNTYFSGFLGHSQVLLFRGDEITRDNGEVVQTWNLLVQERDQAPRQQSATGNAQRGQATWDRSRDHERHAQRDRAQRAGQAVLREAGRDRSPELPQSLLGESEAAIRDLTYGAGR
jgi:hypothetical protein